MSKSKENKAQIHLIEAERQHPKDSMDVLHLHGYFPAKQLEGQTVKFLPGDELKWWKLMSREPESVQDGLAMRFNVKPDGSGLKTAAMAGFLVGKVCYSFDLFLNDMGDITTHLIRDTKNRAKQRVPIDFQHIVCVAPQEKKVSPRLATRWENEFTQVKQDMEEDRRKADEKRHEKTRKFWDKLRKLRGGAPIKIRLNPR